MWGILKVGETSSEDLVRRLARRGGVCSDEYRRLRVRVRSF